jgi:hypothetical protein
MAMAPEPTGRKRGYLKLVACELIALGIGFLGTGGILFNMRAPDLTVRGELFDVVRHSGRGSSTKFGLRSPAGEVDNLHISSAIREIADGDTAEVEYQAGSYAVMGIRIVAGRYSGYEATGQNGMAGAAVTLIAAPVLALFGIMNWLSDGTATPSSRDNKPAPDGDVDTKSMLDL